MTVAHCNIEGGDTLAHRMCGRMQAVDSESRWFCIEASEIVSWSVLYK